MSTVGEKLDKVRARMAAAARRAGREPDCVQLVAVSKGVGPEQIREAVAAGQELFGENYLQEALGKIEQFGPEIVWHFIGHLQGNKAKDAARHFACVETVDRAKLALALEKQAAGCGRVLSVLLQVNIGHEVQKSGVLPEEAVGLLASLSACPHLRVRGLMAMPPDLPDPEAVRPYFRQLRLLADDLVARGLLGNQGPVELSMGMSGDFEVAIEEGATLVRVGTALFGKRI